MPTAFIQFVSCLELLLPNAALIIVISVNIIFEQEHFWLFRQYQDKVLYMAGVNHNMVKICIEAIVVCILLSMEHRFKAFSVKISSVNSKFDLKITRRHNFYGNYVLKSTKTNINKDIPSVPSKMPKYRLFNRTLSKINEDKASSTEKGIFLDLQNFMTDNMEDLTVPPSPEFKSGFVSIVGNPNVGKSTLLNALLKQKLNIVSPKPQTTRHKIRGILTESSYQMVFTDTPGMLKPAYKMHEAMKDMIHGAIREGDVILLVTDVYGELFRDEIALERMRMSSLPVIIAVNKIDLWNNSTSPNHGSGMKNFSEIISNWKDILPNAEFVTVSAANGFGVDDLRNKLLSLMTLGPKFYPDDDISDRDERFFTTELIREALFDTLKEEIPYSCEVVIDSFRDKPPQLSVIEASIFVDRQSQVGIVVGKNGSMLKQLGTVSRKKLENFLQRKVFLSLNVKVDQNWRENDKSLRKYGYIEE